MLGIPIPADQMMISKRALATLVILCFAVGATADAQAQRWFRGNTHTHTLRSDGDSPPDSAARWYRDNGYGFLFITDHETITDPAPLNAKFGKPGSFLLIVGQEVTQRLADTRKEGARQLHVNSLGASAVVMPLGERGLANGITVRAAYERNLKEIKAAGGVPQVNHPNFRWSVRLDDLLALPDSTLMEIANAHILVNNQGGASDDGVQVPSTEALWDSLLTRGKVIFGVGDDDSHSFKPEFADGHEQTRPGRAWTMVRADTLTSEAILSGLRRGDFYASTGVTISNLVMGAQVVRLSMPPTNDRRYVTEFIGRNGRVLARVQGPVAEYRVRGDEGYVRARVTDSNGLMAWTQPIMLPRR